MRSISCAPAVAAMFVVAVLTAACSRPVPVPPGYHRIGAAGGDVLYAKLGRQGDNKYVAVLLRTEDGDRLCDSLSYLITDAEQDFVMCHGGDSEEQVYVAQTSKHGRATRFCREDGSFIEAKRLSTDETWPVDFTVRVDRPGGQVGAVVRCSRLVGE